MPTDDALVGEVRSTLKKLRAAKGRLQGNFYWAGDTRHEEAHLYVTLSSKDKKGQKALAKGKELRKQVTGAKFGRGLVRARGSKLVFELHSGTAPISLLKKSFIRNLSNLDGLKYLKQALVLAPTDDVEEADAAMNAELAAAGEAPMADEVLSDDERTELEADVAAQAEIADLNAQLAEVFLSTEETENAVAEMVAASLEVIAALKATEPVDVNALRAEQAALAESMWTGAEPFPEPGQALSDDVREVLSSALDQHTERLQGLADNSAARIREIHAFALDASDDDREAQGAKMLAELRQHRAAYESYAAQIEESTLS